MPMVEDEQEDNQYNSYHSVPQKFLCLRAEVKMDFH
jgi:hypothetical protein